MKLVLFASISLVACAVDLDEAVSTDEQSLNGDTWTTADNNDYTGGAGASYASITVSPTTKKVFVAGLRYETATTTTWIVRGSPSGTSFALNHTFSLGGTSSRATAILADESGNVYVAGEAFDAANTPHWVIRRSTNDGGSWSTVMDRPYPGYAHVIPTALAIDGWDLVGIFVTGQLVHTNGAIDELTQRSATGSVFVDYPGTAGMATGMLMNGLCTGWQGTWAVATTQAGISAWVVRESSLGDTTWDFESRMGDGAGHSAASCSRGLTNNQALVGGTYGTVWELAAFDGPLPTWDIDHISTGFSNTGIKANTVMLARGMAVGSIGTSATSSTWRTRFATDSNLSVWKDSDNFSLSTSKRAVANAIAHDENGQPLAATVVYVAGDAIDANDRHHGIVRRLVLP